jgi:potassium-transporting ATPase KdpC subunit
MRKDLIASAVAVVVFTVLFGLVYPLVMTGASQLAFPGAADGSRIQRDGKTVGSSLIGQDFRRPVLDSGGRPLKDGDGNPVLEPDPRYFQSRPSVTGYNPAGTYFNNLGPNSAKLRDLFVANLKGYLALEGPYNPGLRAADVPADAVQTSASGVDPHISAENAALQARRVARVRGAPLGRVQALVDEHTDGRSLGVLGEPGVNVLELNLALDQEFPAR